MKKLKASLEKNRNGASKSMSPTSTVLSAHSLVLRITKRYGDTLDADTYICKM